MGEMFTREAPSIKPLILQIHLNNFSCLKSSSGRKLERFISIDRDLNPGCSRIYSLHIPKSFSDGPEIFLQPEMSWDAQNSVP
ncbi:hypothetical protein EUTSA_v10026697mg [Eutrema salsugineum]|uniref:Uncharacterized protein n=1 Tax=Eutrema salsugineum TaxID=72664 RepID=V4P9P1_EUTSA|nr:hypothetical protein EUTSA_v10026697mg [Eutrema salsugineum]